MRLGLTMMLMRSQRCTRQTQRSCSPAGSTRRTRPRSGTSMALAFAGPLKGSTVMNESKSVRVLGADAAIVISDAGILHAWRNGCPRSTDGARNVGAVQRARNVAHSGFSQLLPEAERITGWLWSTRSRQPGGWTLQTRAPRALLPDARLIPRAAQDMVQDAFVRAWRAFDQFDPERASMRTWLNRIATNVCITALKDRGRRYLPRWWPRPKIPKSIRRKGIRRRRG